MELDFDQKRHLRFFLSNLNLNKCARKNLA